MRRILYAYNPDLSKIGTEADVEDGEARVLVRHGRARYVDPTEPVADSVELATDAVEESTPDAVAVEPATKTKARGTKTDPVAE